MAGDTAITEFEAPPGNAEAAGDEEEVRRRIAELSRRISELAAGHSSRISDVAAAQEIAFAVKPYVDRLCALKRLLGPVGGIIEKRERIQQLQAGIAADVAAVEDLAGDVSQAVEPSLLSELEGEIASVKRDRKLFVSPTEADELDSVADESSAGSRSAPALLEQSVPERLRRILGDRFLSAQVLSETLGIELSEASLAVCDALLESVWTSIFETPEFRPHVTRNRVGVLQKAFSDYALVFRPTGFASEIPCTLRSLRERFRAFFVSASICTGPCTRCQAPSVSLIYSTHLILFPAERVLF